MESWVLALALVAFNGIIVAHAAMQAVRNKRHFRRVLEGRTAEAAFESCRKEFPQIESSRVALAYKWVQQLVPFADSVPIEANDDLWEQLRIDQGDADDQFESAQEWRGEGGGGSSPPDASPPRTVRDLMAEVLAYGYEGYAVVPSRRPTKNVAQPLHRAAGVRQAPSASGRRAYRTSDPTSSSDSQLIEELLRATELLMGKMVARVVRHRRTEVLLEFIDGTRAFLDRTQAGLELTITKGRLTNPATPDE